MKTRFSILTGIAALALVFGLAALAACSNPTGGGGGPLPAAAPQSSVLMGTDGSNNTYVLEITENTGARAAYTGKKGDRFKMTIVISGSEKTCTGTVADKIGGEFTLQPSTSGSSTFKAKQSSDGLGSITGAIALDDGTTQTAPAAMTPSTLEVNGEQVYVIQNEEAVPYDGDAKLETGTGDMFMGRITGGKLYLRSLPDLPEDSLDINYQGFLNGGTDNWSYTNESCTYTNITSSFTVTPNDKKHLFIDFVARTPGGRNGSLYLEKADSYRHPSQAGDQMVTDEIQWIYFNGQTKVNGTKSFTETRLVTRPDVLEPAYQNGLETITNMTKRWNNVTLRQGWNKVNRHSIYTLGPDTITDNVRTITMTGSEQSSTVTNTTGYKWMLSLY
jgi:hypothetical protein